MEGREGRRGREIEKEIRGGRVEKRRVGMVVGESRITVARRSINCPQVLFSLPRYFIYRQNVSLCACHGNADRIGTVNRAYFFSSFPFFFSFFFFQSQAIIAGIPNFSLTLYSVFSAIISAPSNFYPVSREKNDQTIQIEWPLKLAKGEGTN